MPEITDVFAPNAFDAYSLTAAIQKIPHAPTMVGDMGLFREIPVATTLVGIEESQGKLTLVPSTPRGGPGIPAQDSKRVVTPFKVPHFQLDDAVMADDVINVRTFGGSGVSPAADAVGRKLASMRRSVDVTNEYCRHQAIMGKIIYPDDSVDSDIDLYTEFGLTNQATDENKLDFLWGTATTKIAETVIPQIYDKIEAALGGTPYTGIVALCGRTFFRNLIGQATVKALYLQQLQQWNLSAVTMAPGTQRRMSVNINGVTFVEYYGKVGTSSGEANDGTFQVTAEAKAFPVGADIFHSYVAPADTIEAAGTMGQPVYARSWPREDGKSLALEVQSNILHICTRPKALVNLYSSN